MWTGSEPRRIIGWPRGVRPRSPGLAELSSHPLPCPVSTSRPHFARASHRLIRTAVEPTRGAGLLSNHARYVQNNPLIRIDPNGLDDYKIFIPDPHGGGGDWSAAASAAKAHGHTIDIKRGGRATIEAYNQALSNPQSRVVFVGHSSRNPKPPHQRTGIVLDNGRSAGTNSVRRDIGAVGPDGVANATEAPLPATNVSANTVALFGCDTSELSSQYAGAEFVGVDSGPNSETSLEALGPAAAAFVQADAAARPENTVPPANPPDPIGAANRALDANRHAEDLDGDRVERRE